MFRSHFKNSWLIILMVVLSAGATFGQTSGFTYQGRLTDGGMPANGNYDLQFALFDAVDGTNQIGQTKIVSSVAVSGGVFTVALDFGASAFPGANRFLEISARPSGAAAFTLLTPRQPLTSTPYAVRSVNASTADTATNAQQLAGVAASQYVKTDDARLSDARDPRAGNSNYVQNSTNQQAGTNFNISGNGTVNGLLSGNTVNAATQYNLAGRNVMSLASANSLSLGGTGNVGIGVVPNSKLAVAGTVESTSGGFKFPDGSVQPTAATKAYITRDITEIELDRGGYTNISTLTLPPGTYLLTATVHFWNKADVFLGDNTRLVQCQFNDEYLGMFYMGAPNNPMYHFTTTMHTLYTQTATGPVSFKCGDYFYDAGKVFAKDRRFSAVRVADNPVNQ
jgi:hypothetical protein